MSKTIGNFKIYFDNNGNMLHSLYSWAQPGSYKEEDNRIFQDRLEYSGCSGSHILFTSLMSGRQYQMFISDFNKVMLAKKLVNNIVEGDFTFTKKGRVQGFKLILPKAP
jgi:hypothetical protein